MSDDTAFAAHVNRLAKPGTANKAELNPHQAHLIQMALGVAGQVGELVNAIKKSAIYQKDIDMAKVREELGDIEFYLQGIRNALKISREEVLEENVAKLNERYHQGSYSDDQAQERADKQE